MHNITMRSVDCIITINIAHSIISDRLYNYYINFGLLLCRLTKSSLYCLMLAGVENYCCPGF